MKHWVVIDAVYAEPRGSGLARYAREMCNHLIPGLRNKYRVLVVGTPDYSGPEGDHFIEAPKAISPQLGGRGHIYRLYWRFFIFPGKVRPFRPVAYYSPVPEVSGVSCPQIPTIHDLIPLHYRGMHWKQAWLFWIQLQLIRTRANKVVSISEATKADWVKWCGGSPANNVHVVHNGVWGADCQTLSPGNQADDHTLPYIIYVGDTRGYKGVDTLIQALSYTRTDVELRIIGSINPKSREKLRRLASSCGVENRVLFEGYVSDEKLESLYGNAVALCLASKAEGFGLVPLEAMSRGTPVIVSDLPVFQEVLDGHATFVNTNDLASWGAAIDSAVRSHAKYDDFTREKIKAYARSFSWSKSADGVAKILFSFGV